MVSRWDVLLHNVWHSISPTPTSPFLLSEMFSISLRRCLRDPGVWKPSSKLNRLPPSARQQCRANHQRHQVDFRLQQQVNLQNYKLSSGFQHSKGALSRSAMEIASAHQHDSSALETARHLLQVAESIKKRQRSQRKFAVHEFRRLKREIR